MAGLEYCYGWPLKSGGARPILVSTMIWQSWCPHCKSYRIAPYRRHTLMEKLLTVLILPYRCARCDLACFKFGGIVHSQ